jgi:tRNA(Ile)-lysidine synthase
LNFAQEQKLSWREDSSNSENHYFRNRVRNLLLPMLSENFDENIVSVLALRAEALSEDSQALWQQARIELAQFGPTNWNERDWFRAFRAKLLTLPQALAWRVCSVSLQPSLSFEMGKPHAVRVLQFVLSDDEGIELPTGLQLRRRSGAVEIVPKVAK